MEINGIRALSNEEAAEDFVELFRIDHDDDEMMMMRAVDPHADDDFSIVGPPTTSDHDDHHDHHDPLSSLSCCELLCLGLCRCVTIPTIVIFTLIAILLMAVFCIFPGLFLVASIVLLYYGCSRDPIPLRVLLRALFAPEPSELQHSRTKQEIYPSLTCRTCLGERCEDGDDATAEASRDRNELWLPIGNGSGHQLVWVVFSAPICAKKLMLSAKVQDDLEAHQQAAQEATSSLEPISSVTTMPVSVVDHAAAASSSRDHAAASSSRDIEIIGEYNSSPCCPEQQQQQQRDNDDDDDIEAFIGMVQQQQQPSFRQLQRLDSHNNTNDNGPTSDPKAGAAASYATSNDTTEQDVVVDDGYFYDAVSSDAAEVQQQQQQQQQQHVDDDEENPSPPHLDKSEEPRSAAASAAGRMRDLTIFDVELGTEDDISLPSTNRNSPDKDDKNDNEPSSQVTRGATTSTSSPNADLEMATTATTTNAASTNNNTTMKDHSAVCVKAPSSPSSPPKEKAAVSSSGGGGGSTTTTSLDCDICLLPYEVGQRVAWSNNAACKHCFHLDCIADWLVKHQSCPNCRAQYI